MATEIKLIGVVGYPTKKLIDHLDEKFQVIVGKNDHIGTELARLKISPFSLSAVVVATICDSEGVSDNIAHKVLINGAKYVALCHFHKLFPNENCAQLSDNAKDFIEYVERQYRVQVSHIEYQSTIIDRKLLK